MERRSAGATPPLLRRMNAGLVLDTLRQSSPLSVTEIGVMTGLSRPTVDAAVEDLSRLGLVLPADGSTVTRRGRPARRFAFHSSAGYVVGVDIGYEAVTAVVSDLNGAPVVELSRPVPFSATRRRRIAEVRRTAFLAVERAGAAPASVLAAAVASPGIIDTTSGRVIFCSALPHWSDFDLRSELTAALGWHVEIDNDANLGAVGERWKGLARSTGDLVFFLVGGRIGAGIMIDGRLVRGHNGGAGEIGFLDMWDEARTTKGSLASATAETVAELVGWGGTTPSRASLRTPSEGDLEWGIDTRAVLEAARGGSRRARSDLERFLASTSYVLATMAMLLNPSLIVLGGGSADDVLLSPLRHLLARLTHDRMSAPPSLAASDLGERVIALGAVRQALDYVESRLLDHL